MTKAATPCPKCGGVLMPYLPPSGAFACESCDAVFCCVDTRPSFLDDDVAVQRAKREFGQGQGSVDGRYAGTILEVQIFESEAGYEISGLDEFERLVEEARHGNTPFNAIVLTPRGSARVLADIHERYKGDLVVELEER